MASNPNNPYADLKLEPHRIDNPPMPWEERRDKAYAEAARWFAYFVLIALVFGAAVYPWKPVLVNVVFCVAFIAGMWFLAGKPTPKRRAGE